MKSLIIVMDRERRDVAGSKWLDMAHEHALNLAYLFNEKELVYVDSLRSDDLNSSHGAKEERIKLLDYLTNGGFVGIPSARQQRRFGSCVYLKNRFYMDVNPPYVV